jgi:aminoglycoside 6'-N-acetyltransferase I
VLNAVSGKVLTLGAEIRLLGPDDAWVLQQVGPDVFDNPVDQRLTAQFLADPRHHIIVAIDAGYVIGMITAVDYIHPDKAPQLWINEVGVAKSHRWHGIGRLLLDAMLAHGSALACTEAWLGTEIDNLPARALYESDGTMPEDFVLYSFDLTQTP